MSFCTECYVIQYTCLSWLYPHLVHPNISCSFSLKSNITIQEGKDLENGYVIILGWIFWGKVWWIEYVLKDKLIFSFGMVWVCNGLRKFEV